MTRTSINFSERYYKLNFNEFPTVRGRTWLKDLKKGMVFDITIQHKPFCKARLKSYSLQKIGELSLAFLALDGDYKDYHISTKEEYLALLNRFRRFHPAKLQTWVTVLILEKVI